MSRAKKIAFIKYGSFSHINESVGRQLEKQFPEHPLVTFEIKDLLRNAPASLLRCVFSGLRHHQARLLEDPLDRLIQTPAGFAFLKQAIASRVRPDEFAFTFQTQSMWDAGVPGLPHFLYTDHTELAKTQYPGFQPEQLFGDWWVELGREMYAHATMNFTMSHHVKKSIENDYGCPASRVTRVGAGGNASITFQWADDRSRFERKEILFVGRDWERKGGPELAAAFGEVLQAHPDARLTIVGCNPRLDLPNTEVCGLLPLEAVAGRYASASLFCLPTRNEPFGISFIEAMLAGLPVVGTELGAVPDLVAEGENGHRVPVGDAGALAEILIRMLHNPTKLMAQGRNSFATSHANHTWDAVGRRMKDIIEPLVNRVPVRPVS